MLKVGIMTWFQYHNYGTALQVTALSEILKRIGCTPTVIKYYTKPTVEGYVDESFIQYFIHKVVQRIGLIGKAHYLSVEKEKSFDEFLSCNLKFSDECKIFSDLESLNDKFDYFVCGSDQIWSPACFDPHYFLDFVSDNRKKIAYAPSVGLPKIENRNIKEEMARLCSSFAHLSTREESGSKIIHDITGREVKTVLDPTLLLSKDGWSNFESTNVRISNSSYLLVYMLGQNKQQWKMIRKIAKELELEIKIIPVYRKDFLRKGCIKFPVGPAEFLSLMHSAAFVCTDSFHGMAFSINYCKQFAVFERFTHDDPINQNSRIYNLADKLDLHNRIIKNVKRSSVMSNQIDYNRVYFKLNSLIEDSQIYLRKGLQIIN